MSDDERFMAAALALGRRGLGRTAPNPSVGALVVKNGIVVGRGVTGDTGRPHGETVALIQAGEAARGATLYVTLEPCSHQGKTPPCCEAILAAGIVRLVYTIADPNPEVAGHGAAFCRDHGIEVVEGVGAMVARRDHRGHIRRVMKQRPMVTLKLAETADGYVAGGPRDPRLAITGAVANGAVHVMRAMHDVIMVGIGTILADDPLMTVRLPGMTARPLRVILDAYARTPVRSRLVETATEVPVWIYVGSAASPDRVAALAAVENVEIVEMLETDAGRLDLAEVLSDLGARGITRVFSEGGPSVANGLISSGFVDEVTLFTAERPLDRDGIPALDSLARAALADAARFRLVATAEIGTDRMRHYESMV